MIYDKIAPDDPMRAPLIMSSWLLIIKPEALVAHPE
jgi:hypothetical protein